MNKTTWTHPSEQQHPLMPVSIVRRVVRSGTSAKLNGQIVSFAVKNVSLGRTFNTWEEAAEALRVRGYIPRSESGAQ